jgi:hypothetical protein
MPAACLLTRPGLLLAALTLACLQDLVAECPAAKELFDKAADILGYDLLKVRQCTAQPHDTQTIHLVVTTEQLIQLWVMRGPPFNVINGYLTLA